MEYSTISKVEAVNHMLTSIGAHPVNTLEGHLNRDVAMAVLVLDQEAVRFQSMGWSFNKELEMTFTPDQGGIIHIAPNVVKFDAYPVADSHPVHRGDRLYDMYKNTDIFTRDVKANVVYLLDWADMPEQARQYITAKSARILNDRVLGDRTKRESLILSEQQEMANFKRYENSKQDSNMLHSPLGQVAVRRRSRSPLWQDF